jgi:SAM-dependent methyltransferase
MASVYEEQQTPHRRVGAGPEDSVDGRRPVSGPLPSAGYGRQPAQIFGEDPILYDRFRPGYPRELMETVVADTGRGPVLEIGAGTGKATRALLALGRPVYALEPDARMAAVLELNCGSGNMSVLRATLEDSDLPIEAFELAVAAQSWHWVDPVVGYARVSEALVSGGRLALLGHHPEPNQGLLGEAMSQLYAKLAPQIASIWPGAEAAGLDPPRHHVGASTRFRGWARYEHQWLRRLDSVGLIGWLCSGAEHRLLPVDQRTQLITAVAALIDELGGEATVKMRTVALLAQRV